MSSRGLVRSVYRALLAQTRAWPADGLVPKASIDVAAYRSLRPFDYLPLGSELDAPPLASLVPEGLVHLPQIQAYGRLTAPAVRACIRANFREHTHAEPAQQGPLLDQALSGLQVMTVQLHLERCSSDTITEGVRVSVTSALLEADAGRAGSDERPAFRFVYRVRIEAVGRVPVRLLGREWVIRNARGEVLGQVPRGSPGVVGETPVLIPGHGSFVYSSSAEIDTPTGTMQGSFQMVELDRNAHAVRHFDATIAPFRLVAD